MLKKLNKKGIAGLRDNPLGDLHIRKHHVWLPPQYNKSCNKRFPVLYYLVGYTGSGLSHTDVLPWTPFSLEFTIFFLEFTISSR